MQIQNKFYSSMPLICFKPKEISFKPYKVWVGLPFSYCWGPNSINSPQSWRIKVFVFADDYYIMNWS
jgi:hypothetical protein